MNRNLTCLMLLALLPFRFFGQYSPQFMQFWNTNISVNPAVAGLYSRVSASAAYIYKGTGYNNQNFFGGSSARIRQIHGGLGLSYANDCFNYSNSGFSQRGLIQSAMLSYAFHIQLKGERALSAGISGGLTSLSNSTNYPGGTSGRDAAGVGGAGVAYRGLKWRFGFSVTNIVASTTTIGGYPYRPGWDMWLTAERDFRLGEKWRLTPRVQAGLYADVSVVAQYNNRLWFGASGRLWSNGYLGGMVGYDIREKFRIGYSFQQYLSGTGFFGQVYNVHEVVLSFNLK